MGTFLDGLYDHEGWAGRRLPDGTITATWTTTTAEFLGYRPQCQCGWLGAAEYAPTEEGEEAAMAEWEREHAQPLLARQVPIELVDDIEDVRRRVNELVGERPLAALEQARRFAKWADALGERAARQARTDGAGWAEVAQAAGTSAQAAQQRYGRGS